MESVDACIEQACVELEKLAWTKQSVKTIGEWAPQFLPLVTHTYKCPRVCVPLLSKLKNQLETASRCALLRFHMHMVMFLGAEIRASVDTVLGRYHQPA